MRLSVGGVAFAIFGVRGVLSFKDNENGPRWLARLLPWFRQSFSLTDRGVENIKWTVLVFMSVLCGISLFSFGGGLLRDALVLRRIPWFIEQINQIFAISVIVLAYIPVYFFIKRSEKRSGLKNFAYIALVIFDAMGLMEFSQGGQGKALAVMEGQASGHTLLFYVFLCGILTQIGGGLCAIVFRCDFSRVRKNVKYYAFALFINSAFFLCMIAGNYSVYTLSVIFLLSIIAAIFVDDDSRKILVKFRFVPSLNLASVSEEIQLICRHIKVMDMYHLTEYFFYDVEQRKLFSNARICPTNNFNSMNWRKTG